MVLKYIRPELDFGPAQMHDSVLTESGYGTGSDMDDPDTGQDPFVF